MFFGEKITLTILPRDKKCNAFIEKGVWNSNNVQLLLEKGKKKIDFYTLLIDGNTFFFPYSW